MNLYLILSNIVCMSDFIAAHAESICAYVLPVLFARGSSWAIKSPFIMKASIFLFWALISSKTNSNNSWGGSFPKYPKSVGHA